MPPLDRNNPTPSPSQAPAPDPEDASRGIALDRAGLMSSYAGLPALFHARVDPTPVREPRLVRVNRRLAEELGLDVAALESPPGVEILAGNRVPTGVEPIAMAYAGHQFGDFVPQLGDGRAVLLGEVTDRAGQRRELHLKGIGRTPFSRGGDGRAHLGAALREYLASEAMFGLGIPTARALALTRTGEHVPREELYPGAVLARVAASHLRVGTFQYARVHGELSDIRALADYAIARHDPDLVDAEAPYQALLRRVSERTANLIAHWMLVGFVHGVMNTDNVALSGETIDFGPFAFMDAYHPASCFSSIDMWGRYAFHQQPGIGEWNLRRFAEALMPLLNDDTDAARTKALAALESYIPTFEARYHAGLREKLGLATERDGDTDLAADFLKVMAEQGADYTLTFRRLSNLPANADGAPHMDAAVGDLFDDPAAFDAWARRWRARLSEETRSEAERMDAMRAVNPAFVLRRHQVEWASQAALRDDDLQPFEALTEVLAKPYDDHPGREDLARPPRHEERVERTFCGT